MGISHETSKPMREIKVNPRCPICGGPFKVLMERNDDWGVYYCFCRNANPAIRIPHSEAYCPICYSPKVYLDSGYSYCYNSKCPAYRVTKYTVAVGEEHLEVYYDKIPVATLMVDYSELRIILIESARQYAWFRKFLEKIIKKHTGICLPITKI